MTLEQQVCSFELAKKLKELGVKQESLFYWHETARLDGVHVLNQKYSDDKFCFSAFSVAELGEMLPECYFTQHRLNAEWECYQNFTKIIEGTKPLQKEYPENHVSMFASTEADARAKMLIYLIENNLITRAKEV